MRTRDLPHGWRYDGSIDRALHFWSKALVTDDFGDRYWIHRCGSCRSWKRLTHEHFGVRARHPNGEVKRWDGWCRPCRNAHARVYYRKMPADQRAAEQKERRSRYLADEANRARRRRANTEQMRRWRRENPDKMKAIRERYNEKLRSDPERLKARRERRRLDRALQRASEGKVEFLGPRSGSGPEVPVAPLAEKIERLRRALGIEIDAVPPSNAYIAFTERLGVSDRTLREWRNGDRKVVRFSTVDMILVNLGWLWWDVYEKPANGHKSGRPEDVLRYIDEAEVYIKASLVFEGELVE